MKRSYLGARCILNYNLWRCDPSNLVALMKAKRSAAQLRKTALLHLHASDVRACCLHYRASVAARAPMPVLVRTSPPRTTTLGVPACPQCRQHPRPQLGGVHWIPPCAGTLLAGACRGAPAVARSASLRTHAPKPALSPATPSAARCPGR